MRRILVLVAILLCLGVLQNYSITVSLSAARGQLVAVTPSVVKQVIIVGVGIFAYWFCSRFKYMRWADISEFLDVCLGSVADRRSHPGHRQERQRFEPLDRNECDRLAAISGGCSGRTATRRQALQREVPEPV